MRPIGETTTETIPEVPLGIMPRCRWLELRALDLSNAIRRYLEAGYDPVKAADMAHELSNIAAELAEIER